MEKMQVLELFNWSDEEEAHLGNLTLGDANGGTLADKKFKHPCYMFETFYAVALGPYDNITQNPGCEWQLQLYTKNSA